ncbi:MAG: dihydrofolate reductase family protein [Anaerolineales bacterium]
MDPLDALAERAAAHRHRDRPFISLSYAQSLDGSLAARPGVRLLLSGPESIALTHRLRAAHDAVLVGIGTVLADDPRLTVRGVPGESPQPIVLDSRLRFPLDRRLLTHPHPPWLATVAPDDDEKAEALLLKGAQVLRFPSDGGLVDLKAALHELKARGISRVMVEGGARIIRSFLAARCVDWVLITIAPTFIGGVRALSADGGIGQGLVLRRPQWRALGSDGIVWGELE